MEKRLKLISRAMQAGMAAVALAGAVTGNLTWVPVAVISLVVSEIPPLLRRDLRLVLPVELNLWIVLALFLHVIGGFSGFYDNLPGWDHLTHAMSSSLIAALGFVTVVALDKYVESIYLPGSFLAFFIVMFTMAMGVSWEVMEYVVDEVTGSNMQYSLSDTMVDLLFGRLRRVPRRGVRGILPEAHIPRPLRGVPPARGGQSEDRGRHQGIGGSVKEERLPDGSSPPPSEGPPWS